MSGAPAPAVEPRPPLARPEVVPPLSRKPKRSNPWLVLLIVVTIVVLGAVIWQKARNLNAPSAARETAAAIRTAKTTRRPVERLIRVTGVTAAANFNSLIAPRLRGSHSDFGRSASTTTSSTPAASSSSSSSGTSAAASSSAPNASSAFQAATNRLATTTLRGSASPTSSSSSSSTASTSSALGSSGLGSTSDSLPGGGGGGGGGNDFMLVLQHVAPAGSMVHKDETIAEFDRQYMMVRLDDYRAALTQGEASLRKRKADLEASHKAHDQLILAAKGDVEKARLDLKTIPVLSALDAEKTRLAFQQAEAKYQQLLKEVPSVLASEAADTKNAELNVEKAGIELKRAEANADKMIVKAPLDGLVVMQTTFRGGDFGQIQQGDQLWPGQFYMQVVDTHSMVINATVNQADVADMRLGQKAHVHFDAYPDLDLPAHVESIAAVTKGGGFRQQFVREVPIRLRIDKMDKRVIPDLSVSADIAIETDQNPPAVVPTGAIFHDSGPTQKAFVFVQDTVGWARRDIEIGLENNLVASVKSGLKPGEIVALDRPLSGNEQVSP